MTELLTGLLHQSGLAALIVAIGFAIKYGSEGLSAYRSSRRAGTQAAIADSATTQATLMNLLRVERDENARKQSTIDGLESEVEQLRTRIFALREEYEAKLGELRKRVQDLTLEIDAMQRLLRPEGT